MIWSALVGIYSRWKFVEEVDEGHAGPGAHSAKETPVQEIVRLRQAIARERRNLESFRRFSCPALAGPCESSIRALESRIRALELRNAV